MLCQNALRSINVRPSYPLTYKATSLSMQRAFSAVEVALWSKAVVESDSKDSVSETAGAPRLMYSRLYPSSEDFSWGRYEGRRLQ